MPMRWHGKAKPGPAQGRAQPGHNDAAPSGSRPTRWAAPGRATCIPASRAGCVGGGTERPPSGSPESPGARGRRARRPHTFTHWSGMGEAAASGRGTSFVVSFVLALNKVNIVAVNAILVLHVGTTGWRPVGRTPLGLFDANSILFRNYFDANSTLIRR